MPSLASLTVWLIFVAGFKAPTRPPVVTNQTLPLKSGNADKIESPLAANVGWPATIDAFRSMSETGLKA